MPRKSAAPTAQQLRGAPGRDDVARRSLRSRSPRLAEPAIDALGVDRAGEVPPVHAALRQVVLRHISDGMTRNGLPSRRQVLTTRIGRSHSAGCANSVRITFDPI